MVDPTCHSRWAADLVTADDPKEVSGVTINDEPWACDGGRTLGVRVCGTVTSGKCDPAVDHFCVA
jgi:hypothetical protein